MTRKCHIQLALFLSLVTITRDTVAHVKRKLHTLTRCSIKRTTIVTRYTSITVWSISQISARLNANTAVWKTLTMTVALTSCEEKNRINNSDKTLNYDAKNVT